MHLADITMFYTPYSGGVRRYLDAKRRWLSRFPHCRHSLLTPGPPHYARHDAHYTQRTLPLPFSHGYYFPLSARPWTKQLIELGPDIIEAGDPYRLAYAALSAGQQLGVPVVGFYHSDLPRLLCSRLGAWVEPLVNRYVSHLYRQFDQVLAPSGVMAARLKALGVEAVQQQPLGVDTERFHPKRRDPTLRKTLGLSPDTRLLIFAGRYAAEKNLRLLIRAIRRLGRPYHLLMVGPKMPFRSEGNVTVCARSIDTAALSRLLASADALVHAGDQETFGLIILEAMASGLPVVGVEAGAVAELVTPEVGILARPNDADSFAQAVQDLFAQDVRCLGDQARAYIEQHWSWDQALRQLLQTYTRLRATSPCTTPVIRHAST